MTTRETCNLIFNTSLDGRRVVRIPDPCAGLTVGTVQFAANLFINANPFDETVGSLISLANAERIITTRTVLF